MDSFFIRPNTKGKPKGPRRGKKGGGRTDEPQRKRMRQEPRKVQFHESDEELTSDEESDNMDIDVPSSEQSSESGGEVDHETADEKRIRLAKQALKAIEEEVGTSDDEAIGERLREDALRRSDRHVGLVADSIPGSLANEHSITLLRGHKLPVTCVAISSDSSAIYTGSKDCCVMRWDPIRGQRVGTMPGHRASKRRTAEGPGSTHHVLAVAVSSDGRMLVSGGHDKALHLCDTRTMQEIEVLHGHGGSITGLSFRRGTDQLFSASIDRTVKVWSMSEMACLDTLYGHQNDVMSVCGAQRDRCITGGRDASVRLWKIPEQSSLLFRPTGQCLGIDCVSMSADNRFVSGSDDGTVSMWSMHQKKPLSSVQLAHGPPAIDAKTVTVPKPPTSATTQFLSNLGMVTPTPTPTPIPTHPRPNWISSIASMWHTDLFASGSCDGHVRLWKYTDQPYRIIEVGSVKAHGWINGLEFGNGFLACAIGQEHRLGRWSHYSSARNGLGILPLSLEERDGESEEEDGESEEGEEGSETNE